MSGRSADNPRRQEPAAPPVARPAWARAAAGWTAAGGAALALLVWIDLVDTALLAPGHWSGWALAALLALQFLPGLGRPDGRHRASALRQLHLHLGWIAVVVFVIHAGGFPAGGLHRVLWVAFALLAASGFAGLAYERLGGLRQREWDALPYPRIAHHRDELAASAATAFGRIVENGCPPLLAHLYAQRLVAFLAAPRYLWAHWMGSPRPLADLLAQLDHAGSTLRQDEHFLRLRSVVIEKDLLDQRWALHWLQRGWLFVHVPAAAVAVVLTGFHVLFVRAFGG